MPDSIVFVNIGWMVKYAGMSATDPTIGGHGYLKGNSFGHESWNFSPLHGKVYGYVPGSARFNLKNFGKLASDHYADGITVVWIARNPRNGATYIVGWFDNARVYSERNHIELERKSGVTVHYQIEATASDSRLLEVEQRQFIIPTDKKVGNLGQSPIWYGGTDAFRNSVRLYLNEGRVISNPKPKGTRGSARQTDPELRKKIELAAVRHATSFYESKAGGNRTVESVEKDGVGWDLNVTAPNGEILKVEVKGLTGSAVVVELTPNEFEQMQSIEHRQDYIIYIVTDAGTEKAVSHVFYHDKENSSRDNLVWAAGDGRVLEIQPRTGARLSIR